MFKNPRMVKQPLRTEWCLGEDQDIPGQFDSQKGQYGQNSQNGRDGQNSQDGQSKHLKGQL